MRRRRREAAFGLLSLHTLTKPAHLVKPREPYTFTTIGSVCVQHAKALPYCSVAWFA